MQRLLIMGGSWPFQGLFAAGECTVAGNSAL